MVYKQRNKIIEKRDKIIIENGRELNNMFMRID